MVNTQGKTTLRARNVVKITGFIGALASATVLISTGQYAEACGLIAAALSSPLNASESEVQ